MARAFPVLLLAAAALWLGTWAVPPGIPKHGFDIHAFGKIPVAHDGRVKPLDSLARTLLRVISDRETFVDGEGKSRPAIQWALDVMADFNDQESRARKYKVFRITHPQILSALGLEGRERYRYSIEEFGERLPALGEAIGEAHKRREAEQTLDPHEQQLLDLERKLGYFERLARFNIPHLIPPSGGGEEWHTLTEAMKLSEQQGGAANPAVEVWRQILQAYGERDAAKFNAAVTDRLKAEDSGKYRFESFFNHFDPLNQCKTLYFIGFLLVCLAWIGWSGPLNRAAFGLISLTYVVHTLALVARIYLSGRPPVTNLYGSAIFIGWGCVLFGLLFEKIYRLGLGLTIATVSGYVTLLIAHILAADGDTMAVLQAVLDTQFWLATHVTCITMGYAATYVAGLLAVIFILRGVFTPSLTPVVRQNLSRMIHGTVCFAMFFSFVGTVLGGLWADDSWGRFWGWDPKENGALMIVLWNALLLHARWGGLARDRGVALLAVFGNIVVSWSWFGVNQLGVGLHAYGFTEGRTFWLLIFVLSQLAVMGAGLVPERRWRSAGPAHGAHAEGR